MIIGSTRVVGCCVLLAGCTAASPPSQQSLTRSLEQIVGSLSDARDYAAMHEHGQRFGLYVCEADVNLELKQTVGADGGFAFDVAKLGADASREAGNTIQLKLQDPRCEGKQPIGHAFMLRRR